ncbi:sensor histidine kinase [Pedobacter sp. 22226]
MKNWIKTNRWHILGWLIFIVYENLVVALTVKSSLPLSAYVTHYAINIGLFYFHWSMLRRLLFIAGHYRFLLFPLVLAEIIVYVLLNNLASHLSPTPAKAISLAGLMSNWKFVFATVWRAIYFMLFSTAYYFFSEYIRQSGRTAELEKDAAAKTISEKQTLLELAEARNANLKSQINPHFLFNTLTYIYNSTHRTEPRSAEAVRYLTKLMRYALECEKGPELMPLEAEIRQVEHLLQLSRIKQPSLFVDFSYDGQVEETAIIPLVVLSLTENMVKHGNLSVEEDPGKIRLALQGNKLEIETVNLINTGLNDTGFHTGLVNIEKRLSHTYGESSDINYGKQGDYFRVLVIIRL